MKNGIGFHDFDIFENWYKVRYTFSTNFVKSGIAYSKICPIQRTVVERENLTKILVGEKRQKAMNQTQNFVTGAYFKK